MKTKLLKKVRKQVEIHKRNKVYYVETTGGIREFDKWIQAIGYYRYHVIKQAKYLFGYRPKEKIN